MTTGKPWTRDELMIAMNLYCKLPFGQLHYRNPLIAEIARKLGRTPGSLAMKLCNFASLDPAQQARGIRGLSGASRTDQEIWQEFHENWEKLGTESQELISRLLPRIAESTGSRQTRKKQERTRKPPEVTQVETSVRARRGQDFFRQTVLASYGNRCCVTGNPIPELLVASHILPWSQYPSERMNPRNGLCLAATHDVAFDRGLMTLDEDNRLVISKDLREHVAEESIRAEFVVFEGKRICLP